MNTLTVTVSGTSVETTEPGHVDDLVDLSSINVGQLAANVFAGFTNPILRVQRLPGGAKAVVRADGADWNVTLQSVYSCRDSEVVTWLQKGSVFLRLLNGRALFFNLNVSESHSLRCGIATGVTAFAGDAQFYTRDSVIFDLAAVPGWSASYRPGDQYTFGTSGFDVYVKYNSVEVLRFKEYRHVSAGVCAVYDASGTNWGVPTLKLKYSPYSMIGSNRDAKVFDIRDFGAKTATTIGSIAAGSMTLNVTSAVGFAAGDHIIVATGGETTLGARGSTGVGGVWPALSFSDVTTMSADRGRPDNTWAWDRSTGLNYFSTRGKWNLVTSVPAVNDYYAAKALPLALLAKVLQVSDNTLNLDTPAIASANNAIVCVDNSPAFYVLTDDGDHDNLPMPANMEIHVPAGRFALGTAINGRSKPGIKITGDGAAFSTLYSPRGTICSSITLGQCDTCEIADLTIQGNHKVGPSGEVDGFALRVNPTTGAFFGWHPTVSLSLLANGVVRNVSFIDLIAYAVAFGSCTDAWCYSCDLKQSAPAEVYTQWYFTAATCTRGGFQDCTVSGPKLIKAFETFNSVFVKFVRCGGKNALCSTNSSGGYVFDGFYSTIEANSYYNQLSGFYHEPIMNVNANAYHGSSNLLLGGTIINPKIIQNGFTEPSNRETIPAIMIQSDCINVNISGQYPNVGTPTDQAYGGYLSAPDYSVVDPTRPYSSSGAVAIYSDAPGTTIMGIRSIGRTASGHGNIQLSATAVGSSVYFCVADSIRAAADTLLSNNQTNKEWLKTYPNP